VPLVSLSKTLLQRFHGWGIAVYFKVLKTGCRIVPAILRRCGLRRGYCVPVCYANPAQARETPAFAAQLRRMRSHSAAIALHRGQLLATLHAIRWKPPLSTIHLTDSRRN
jgi:hypothetical protein